MSDSIKHLSPPRSASKATESNTQDFHTLVNNDRDVNNENIIGKGENKRDSQSYEELAFRSQFEEVNQAVARLLESSNRTNNQYNRGYFGRSINAPFSGLLPPKRTEYTHHHRTYSQPAFWGTPTQHVVRHQRSTSSLDGTSSHAKYYASLPQIPPINGYNIYLQDLDEYYPYFEESNSSSRKVENGSSRSGFKYESDWNRASAPFSSTSGISLTPFGYGSFNPLPLTPPSLSSSLLSTSSSSSSSCSSTNQPRTLSDGDEFPQKQVHIETDRKLLQLQQRQLDNKIALHSSLFGNDSTNKLSETPPISLQNESPKFFTTIVPSKEKDLPSSSRKMSLKILSNIPRLSNQEPIGTPNRKSGLSTPNSLIDTNSAPASGFSLFAQSPTMSLSHTFASCNSRHNYDTSFDSFAPFDSLPLLSDTPPKEDYFETHRNADVSKLDVQQPTTLFAPFFSSPVYESDEETCWNDEISFEEFDPQMLTSLGLIESDWDRCHERMVAMTKEHREKEAMSLETLTRRSRNVSHGSNGPTFESQLRSTYHIFDKEKDPIAHANRLSQNLIPTQEDLEKNKIRSQMWKEEFPQEIQQACGTAKNHMLHARNKQTLGSNQELFGIMDPAKQRIGSGFELKSQQSQSSNMFQKIGNIDTQLQSVNEIMMNLKINVQEPPIFHHLPGGHGLEVV